MRPRAFVEAPAGLAAVSLALHGGMRCRPPISRCGNKAGYAHAILDLAGLTPGRGAGAYVWAEADADVRGLLRAYPDPAMLLRIADIIRGWSSEEPRALWERLRAERKARGAAVEPDVAGWVLAGSWSYRQGEIDSGYVGPGARRQDTSAAAAACNKLATYAQTAGWMVETVHQDRSGGFNEQHVGRPGDRRPYDIGNTRDSVERLATYAQTAGWLFVAGNTRPGSLESWKSVPEEAAQGANVSPIGIARVLTGDSTMQDRWFSTPLASVGWPPVAVLPAIPTAADLSALLGTPGDLEGVVAYQDPPYVGTTGYLADLSREDVVRTALDYAAAGAVVLVSEAVALPELVAAGWYAERIDHARRGQARTFSKQKEEWVTMNRAPAHVPPQQAGLFGGAR